MSKAFTLIEVLILIGILSILFLFLPPALNTLKSSISLNDTTQQIVADLRLAQQRSLASGETYQIAFEDTAYTISGRVEAVKKLPEGLKFENNKIIRFSKSGFPEVGKIGTIVLKDRYEKTKKVIISSVGRVRVE